MVNHLQYERTILKLIGKTLKFSVTKNLQKLFKSIHPNHQFSRSVVSYSLQPNGLQHARLPVHHQLPELTQTHVYWAGDAIQSSHPLSSPSPPAFNLSQHQRLFQWVSSSHQVAKVFEGVSASASVLPVNIQDWFPLGLTSLISLQSKGLSRVFSSTNTRTPWTVWKS